jgi:hypothetical protein
MEQEKTTQQAMATHYQGWQASGMSQMAYSSMHGLTFHKFNYWCRKFQKAAGHSGAPASGFVSVRVKQPAPASTAWLEIERADGSRLRFYQPVEAAFLKSLLD